MLKLKIDRGDFVLALSSDVTQFDSAWYLDTKTGKLLLDTEEDEHLPEDLHENPRYLSIDAITSSEAFEIMESFVDSLEEGEAATRLADALGRPKPFRRFKDALYDFEGLPDRWFAFELEAHARMANQWCEENDIDPEWV